MNTLLKKQKFVDRITATYNRKPLPMPTSVTLQTVTMRKSKKIRVPYASMTTQGNPTQYAITAFFVYLTNVVDTEKKLCPYALKKVREYFNMDRGFEQYLRAGMQLKYGRHQNSGSVYLAMSKAYMEAKGMIGKGIKLAEMSMN